jgi:hypothetical protein
LCASLVTIQSIILGMYMHMKPLALLLISEGLPKKFVLISYKINKIVKIYSVHLAGIFGKSNCKWNNEEDDEVFPCNK